MTINIDLPNTAIMDKYLSLSESERNRAISELIVRTLIAHGDGDAELEQGQAPNVSQVRGDVSVHQETTATDRLKALDTFLMSAKERNRTSTSAYIDDSRDTIYDDPRL